MHAIWHCTLVLSLTRSFFVSLCSFQLDSRFPSVNRECIVPVRSCLSSVLTVLSVGITMMDWDPLDACNVCKWTFLVTLPHSVLTVCKQQWCLVWCAMTALLPPQVITVNVVKIIIKFVFLFYQRLILWWWESDSVPNITWSLPC